MYTDKLKHTAVVSLAEGARLGRVEESLFTTQPLRLAALRVKGDQGEFVVPYDQIRSIGADAITLEDSAATQAAVGANESLIGWDDLKKRKVVDAAGTLLGTISNLEFDATTGQIARLTVHKGGVLGIGGESSEIDASAIQSVGSELITVAG